MVNALLDADSPALAGFVPEWSKPREPTPEDYRAFSRQQAMRYGIDPDIEARKINQESGFRTHGEDGKPLRSPVGARGIAQFMPGTAADEGIDPDNPWQALEASARHSANLLKTFNGDQRAATAAYNAGAGNIGKLTSKYGADWENHLEEALGKDAAQTRLYLATILGDGQGIHPPDVGDAGLSHISPPGVDPSVHPQGARPVSYGNEAVGAMLKPWNLPELADNTGDGNGATLGNRFSQPESDYDKANRIANSLGGGGLGGIKDIATTDIPILSKAKGYAGDLAEKGLIGLPGISQAASVNSAVSDLTDLPNVFGYLNRAGTESAVPTTPLDVATTIGPGNIFKGAKGVVRGAKGADGALRIISDADRAKSARQMYEALIKSGKTDEDIVAAFGQSALDLAKGGAASSRAVTAAPKLQSVAQAQAAKAAYERVLKDTGSVEMATDAARKAAGAEGGATKTLRTRAQQMQDAMGPGAVEPKKTGWTITNKAGESRQVETDLPHGYQDAADPMKRFEQNVADQEALNRGMAADSGVQRAKSAQQGIDTLKGGAKSLIDNAPPAGAILDANGNVDIAATLADEADRIAREGVTPKTADKLAELASAAKRLGDPASEIRRGIQQGGDEQGQQIRRTPEENAALKNERTAGPGDLAEAATKLPRGDMFTDAAKAEKQAASSETKAAREAERRAVEASQARVEAADLARRRDEWIAKTRQTVEGMAAPGSVPADATAKDVLAYAERLKAARETVKSARSDNKVLSEVGGALGIPRAMSLAADIGTMRDLTILGSSRQGFGAAASGAKEGAKAFLSEEAAQAAQKTVESNAWHDFVTSDKNFARPFHVYQYGEGVPADLRVPEMSSLNASNISRAVGNLPWVKASDRALAVQRNVAGMKLLSGRAEELAQKYGTDSEKFYSEMQSTIDWVNHTRGYSGGNAAQKLGGVGFLISPQQLISRLQLIGDPISFAARGDRESAKFAAENLLTFATTQTAMLTLLKMGGGGRLSVDANPTSSDFGKVRVGNTRYDTLAGLGPTIRLVSRIGAAGSDEAFGTDYAKNQAEVSTLLTRWLENKENPSSKMVTDYMLHNKLPDEKTAINSLVPSLASGIMETLQNERGANKLLAVPNTVANFGGVGTTTYKTANDEADQIASDTYGGRKFGDLTDLERLPVIAKLPEDNKRAVVTQERQGYEEARKKAGYVTPPKDEDGKPVKENEDVRKNRLAANAEVFAKNPELDVRRWFWSDGGDDGGPVHSKDAALTALDVAKGMPGRAVTIYGLDRALNADADTEKLYRQNAGMLEQFFHPDPELVKAFAGQAKYKGKTKAEADKGALDDVRDAVRKIPQVDALLVFMGHGGDPDARTYTLHTKASLTELNKLYDQYPNAAKTAKEGWGIKFAKDAR